MFKDGDNVYIQSRDLKPLGRYFPELEASLRTGLPERCVLDGEVVIVRAGRLDFEAMLLRIHPAASRVQMLAAEHPASYVAWDLLALGDDRSARAPAGRAPRRLDRALAGVAPPIHVTPLTRDPKVAADWFQRFEGAGLDGVIAKPETLVYTPGKRVMAKIKHQRTADCVVAGFRWYKGGKDRLVGSLLLGLYDGAACCTTSGSRRRSSRRSAPARGDAEAVARGRARRPPVEGLGLREADRSRGPTGAALPGATSRWNRGKDLSWEPIRLELVCEVSYDHLQGTRFRHATSSAGGPTSRSRTAATTSSMSRRRSSWSASSPSVDPPQSLNSRRR